MSRFILVSCLLFLTTGTAALACSLADKQAYRDVATSFCRFVSRDAKPQRNLFTPDLINTIKAAQARNAAWAIAHPGDKPPLGDGVPYQAFPDRSACTPGTNIHLEHQLYMEVQHTFPHDAKANWTDRLKLAKTPQGWRVDDVVYGRDYKNGLRDALKNVHGE